MNRIPPSLLYLTIYNPTLRPSEPVEDDDEDAEEQAHILFYTSKERAVSRDRMLRQIGLAKALINFAEVFNGDDPCNNVHSQTKRMLMISPEPNFWIHACVEVAKVLRVVDSKSNSKTKNKAADKGKEKEPAPQYDYQDGSVHDGAICAHIMKGYERFKLTHGSFASILSSLGQQALELQLERFWTVWAWSWDMDEMPDFGEEFGPHLHPHFSSVIPLVDEFATNLSLNSTPVVLSRSHIIPPTRYTQARHPASLITHLSSMIPAYVSSSLDASDTLAASVETIRGRRPPAQNSSEGSKSTDPGTFLGMPAMNVNMDMRKWNWPGYLTFGKGNSTKPPLPKGMALPTENEKDKKDTPAPIPPADPESPHVEAEVNTDDLEDAIASDSRSVPPLSRQPSFTGPSTATSHPEESDGVPLEPSIANADTSLDITPPSISRSTTVVGQREETPPPSPPPLPEFSMTKLHLSSSEDPTATKRVTVHYLTRNGYMIALLNMQEQGDDGQDSENVDLQYASEHVTNLLDDVEARVYELDLKSISDSLPSATKILQTQDRHLIATDRYTLGSPGFASKSSHLFNAKAVLDKDPGISEVFSRGQNPQYWHIARRGLGGSNQSLGLTGSDGEVFMEVFSKESSLTDVDNVLTGVVKKSGLVDG